MGRGKGAGPGRAGRHGGGFVCLAPPPAVCFFYYFFSFLHFFTVGFLFWFGRSGRCGPRGQGEARSGRARRRSGAPLLMALPRCAAGMGLARLRGVGGHGGLQVFLLCFAQVSFGTPFFQEIFIKVNGTAGAQAVSWCHPLIHSCFTAFSAQSPFPFRGGTTTPNLNP